VQLVREVLLERAAVDLELAGAGDQADAGDGLLAAAGRGAGGDHGGTNAGRRGRGRALGAVGDLAVLLVGERACLVEDFFGGVVGHVTSLSCH
jgi:hypothetical protein